MSTEKYRQQFPIGFLDWVRKEYDDSTANEIIEFGIGVNKRVRDDRDAWNGAIQHARQGERERLKRFFIFVSSLKDDLAVYKIRTDTGKREIVFDEAKIDEFLEQEAERDEQR